MTRLLHISASPRRELSHSLRAASSFIAGLQAAVDGLEVDRLDIWNERLPEFAGALLSAKYATLDKVSFDEKEAQAWADIRNMVERLDAADAVLLSTPMWNMSIPYRLKHYLDLVTQPGLTFTFDPQQGYSPLLRNRPTVSVVATSGDFTEGTSWGRPDMASAYLRQALKFVGLADSAVVLIGPTRGNPDLVAAGAKRARNELAALAGEFAETLK